MAGFPIKNLPMPNAPRGQGNLGTRDGGKPSVKPLSYDPPKGPKGIHGGAPKRVYKTGSQDCSS